MKTDYTALVEQFLANGGEIQKIKSKDTSKLKISKATQDLVKTYQAQSKQTA